VSYSYRVRDSGALRNDVDVLREEVLVLRNELLSERFQAHALQARRRSTNDSAAARQAAAVSGEP